MALEVGSMLVKAKFDAGNLYTGLGNVITKLKGAGMNTKSLNTEFRRMKGTLIGLTAIAGLTAGSILGMLTSAIMQSPFLAGVLAKLKIQFMLFGNAIAKHVKPILEDFVKLIKWLREKFEALPDPIQGSIVKIIIFGGIILGILSIIGTFILLLAAVKSALLVLIPAGLIATLTAFGAKIAALIAGSLLLQVALGLVAGIIGVLLLDRSGFLTWISDIGEGFRNWDSILRDVIISLLGLPTLIGGIAIDISRGDMGFSTTKAWGEEWKNSVGRVGATAIYGNNQYGQGSSSTSSASDWESYQAGRQNIETQTNNITIDASGVTGNIDDPVTQAALIDIVTRGLAEKQNTETY